MKEAGEALCPVNRVSGPAAGRLSGDDGSRDVFCGFFDGLCLTSDLRGVNNLAPMHPVGRSEGVSRLGGVGPQKEAESAGDKPDAQRRRDACPF